MDKSMLRRIWLSLCLLLLVSCATSSNGLSGRFSSSVGEQVIECKEGSVVRIPPEVVHWAEPPAPEDGVAINMDIWTPYRPDFGAFTSYQTDDFSSSASKALGSD